MKSKDAEKELHYWLERFNITEHLNKKVGELSKGISKNPADNSDYT